MANYNKKYADMTPEEQAADNLVGQYFGPMLVVDQYVNERGYSDCTVQCLCGRVSTKGAFNLKRNPNLSCGRGCMFFAGRGRNRKS